MAETAVAENPAAAADTAVNELLEHTEAPEDPQTALTQPSSDNAAVTTTDGDAPQKKTKKIIRRKKRPARPQVDPSTIKSEPPPQTGTIFNIWYAPR
jgi:hypothetical protein